MRRVIVWAAAVVGVLVLILPAPDAASQPLCEHRAASHAAEHHMTREADSRFHVEHGELPTCGLDDHREASDHEDNDRGPRRDHPGFHCTWHGCG